MTSAIKAIGINELVEQEKGPIWVINTSNELYPTGAEVYVTIGANVMTIPRTWLPIQMTDRFPRKTILESNYFVEALSKGLLKAIPKEAAEKLLAQPGAEKEKRRLKDIEDAIKAATAARGIGKNVLISTGDTDRDEDLQNEFAERTKAATKDTIEASGGRAKGFNLNDDGDDEVVDPISANFKAWVAKVNGIEDADEAFSEARMRGNMTLEEAEYLMKNVDHENISSFIAKKIKKTADAA